MMYNPPGLGVGPAVERDDVITLLDGGGLDDNNGNTAAGEKKQNETLIFHQPKMKMKKCMTVEIPPVFMVRRVDCFSSSCSSS